MSIYKRTQGFTLIEIMVALVISLFLLAGVITLMISSKRSYNTQMDAANLQENARFAIEFIARDVQMSGYMGCSNEPTATIPSLRGTENTDSNNSDSLIVSYADTTAGTFSFTDTAATRVGGETVLKQGQPLDLLRNDGFILVNDWVVVSDCGGAETHRVSEAGIRVKTVTTLSKDYNNGGQSEGAQVRRMVRKAYRVMPSPTGGFSLFLCVPTPLLLIQEPPPMTCEELVQGVMSMQLRFGVDTNDDGVPNVYVPANGLRDGTDNAATRASGNSTVSSAGAFSVCDRGVSKNIGSGNAAAYMLAGATYGGCPTDTIYSWDNVVSVRLSLLMHTLEQRYDLPPDHERRGAGVEIKYDLDPIDGTAEFDPLSFIQAKDNYRRYSIFTTTIQVRNSAL